MAAYHQMGNDSKNQAAHPQIADVLNHIEGILIASLEPPLNRQGGRWKKAVHYLQYVDPATEPPDAAGKVDDIWEWMEAQKAEAAKAKKKKK